jgi:hypothetical protein
MMCGLWVMLGAVGCGSSPSSESAAVKAANSSVYEMKGRGADFDAVLTSTVALENAEVKSAGGWLVLSFTAQEAGTATLHVSYSYRTVHHVTLSLGKGVGAVVLDPYANLSKLGQVSGKFSRECGPQGARCEEEIPTTEKERSYPCGPQGAMCRITVPDILPDLNRAVVASASSRDGEEYYVCGPQGAMCRKDPAPAAPAPRRVCGPQGATCGG